MISLRVETAKTKQHVGVISLLSAMDEKCLNLFLGNYEPIDNVSIDEQRLNAISLKIRARIKTQRMKTARTKKRRLYAALFISAATLFVILSLAFVIANTSKASDASDVKNSSPNIERENSINELSLWINSEENIDYCAEWMRENGIPVLTSLAKADECRFVPCHNALKVIYQKRPYMIYLLDGEKNSVNDACLEAGIDIYAEYKNDGYSFGQTYVNGKACDSIMTSDDENGEFCRYYILSGNVLLVIDAENGEQISNLTLEYIK